MEKLSIIPLFILAVIISSGCSSYAPNENYIEIGKDDYFSVYSPFELNGKLAYLAYGEDGFNPFIVSNGIEYGKDVGVIDDFLHPPREINRKLAYVAAKDRLGPNDVYSHWAIGREWIVYYDNEPIYNTTGLHNIEYPIEYKESIIVPVYSGERKHYSLNGNPIGQDYDDVLKLVVVNDSIVMLAERGGKNYIVKEDGEEEIPYDAVFLVPGMSRLTYKAREGNEEFVFYGSEEYRDGFENVFSIIELDDIAFIAEKDGKEFMYYKGKQYYDTFDKINRIQDIGGKLVVEGIYHGKSIILYGNETLGLNYMITEKAADIDGKIAFEASKGNTRFIVMEK